LELKLIEGEHGIRQDLAAINPDFPQSGHTRNCGNCAAAYELRRRGHDVEAKAGEVMFLGDFAAMFDGINVQSSAMLSTTDAASETAQKIEQEILSWGEGARGFILGQWSDLDYGHYFSAEVNGGAVMFVDGQNGKSGVKYLEKMIPQEIHYARLDNLKFNNSVANYVKNRGV